MTATLIRPQLWGAQKPPPGASLRGGSTLLGGLENLLLLTEGAGAPRNIAPPAMSRWPVATLGTGVTWAPGQGGPALAFPGTADVNLDNAGTDAYSVSTNGYSLVVRVYLPSASLKGVILDGGASVNLGVGSGDIDTNGNNLVALYSNVRHVASGVAIGTGWHTVGITVNTSGGAALWLDGRQVYSDSGSAPQSFGGTRRVGSEDGGSRFLASGCRVEWGGWWRRSLTPSDMQQLAVAPFDAFVAPPAPRLRYWVLVSSGVTGSGGIIIRHPALAASGTTTVKGTGALTVHHPTLSATGTSTITATGALTIRHPLLSGTGAFVNATGALTIRHPTLSATGTTTSTGAGTLTIQHPTLAASGAQGPTAMGALTIAHPTLAASGTTTVTGTGALTVRHPVLAATGTTTVTGTGSVTISHPTLLGASPGTVTGSGALTVRHPVLAASGTTTVTGTGSLTIAHPLLSGTAPATITGTGALAIRHPGLAALGTLTIVGHGALTIRHPVLAGSDQAERDITIVVGSGGTRWTARGGGTRWTVGQGVR
jgi:hypothetical protein